MNELSCKNCKHCHKSDIQPDLSIILTCRYNPPQSFPTPQGILTLFPHVSEKDYCSRYENELTERIAVN